MGNCSAVGTPGALLLLRHGESEWNASDQFTGWVDVALTARGEEEARRAGRLLAAAGLLVDVVHTSLLHRSIRTAEISLEELGRSWIPVQRSWRLNERHYGALQGKGKAATLAEFGEGQFLLWRRSYSVPPPPLPDGSPMDPGLDPRYQALAPELLPRSECLADVIARLLPYWYDAIVPQLRLGLTVLVVAHGNSLRALVKHLDHVPDDAIADLNIPTGIPLRYDLDQALRPLPAGGRYLDEAAAVEAIEKVRNQGT